MIERIIVIHGKLPEDERAVVFTSDDWKVRIMSNTKAYEKLAEYAAYFNMSVEEVYAPLTKTIRLPCGRSIMVK